MTFINHRNAFLKVFNTTARDHHRHKEFEDFVSCAAQLSLCGIAAEVVTGNSLTLTRHRTLYTPLHYTGRWAAKLDVTKQRAA